ncbi:MAG: hypothetical protein HYS07_07175 [Chlamydiae bacterium]|nr:hypothetical protein [Chlamydiota bacterium]MBI3276925.1 hypothetical protein [Chlamydiota bacterium]
MSLGRKDLERRIKLLEDFMGLWKELHGILESSAKNDQISVVSEENFLRIKAEIARRQAHISEILQLNHHFSDEVMSLMSQIVSIRDFSTFSSIQTKRVESQWHNLFILMNGQMGKYEAYCEGTFSKWMQWLRHPVIVILALIGILLGFYFLGHKLR